MPDFWEFPTVSMGLGPINAIYQARFNQYLLAREIKDTSRSHVWAFLGDGEMDEPEALGAIGLAAREELDNLTFVINCNLQRLDGPVRGNGKIIQELEAFFRGAGWNVIKVIWGRDWDPLLAKDTDGVLVNKMNNTPDGQFQTYSVEPGSYTREHFFGTDPRLRAMVEHLSDDEVRNLSRGGHDYRKVYAAFKAAQEHVGQPTVILAHTIKGWTLGPDRHPPDEEAHGGRAEGVPRPALPADPGRRAGGAAPAVLPPGRGVRGDPVHAGAPGGARRLPAQAGGPGQAAQAAGRPGLRRDEARLRQAAGGDHDGLRPAAQGPDEGP
jgi:pyruvate dehydrogenase complex dehydrogenase (E1) component